MHAGDFYFAPIRDEGAVAFGFVEKKFYDKNGCLDSSNDAEDFVPENFSNLMEACWEYYNPKTEDEDELFQLGALELLEAGFVYNKDLENYLNSPTS